MSNDKTTRDGGPAFPREDYQTLRSAGQCGMSLRDWFAGQALAGGEARHLMEEACIRYSEEGLAEAAYRIADFMLAERAKETA